MQFKGTVDNGQEVFDASSLIMFVNGEVQIHLGPVYNPTSAVRFGHLEEHEL